jgi:hypothetical protein
MQNVSMMQVLLDIPWKSRQLLGANQKSLGILRLTVEGYFSDSRKRYSSVEENFVGLV